MFEPDSPELGHPRAIWTGETPRVQAILARHRPFFVLLAVLLGQLLLLSFQITREQKVSLIRVWAVAVFDPIERSLHKVVLATSTAWRTYGGLWEAQQENQQLRLELVAEHAQIRQLSEQAAEARRLRALLDFKNRLPLKTTAAEVIATSPGEASGAVFIDKGSTSGLVTDLPVLTPEGIVGKIIAVFPYTAQVLLITDPSSGVGCMLERSRAQGVLKGTGQNLCQLHYILNDETVSVGETVLTSGLDQIYPKGFPVGTVVQVKEDNTYKSIVVKPVATLDRLESTLVVLKPTSREQPALSFPVHR